MARAARSSAPSCPTATPPGVAAWTFLLLLAAACAHDAHEGRPVGPLVPPAVPADPPNVLLVILDDVGVWDVAAYGAADPARTPTLDQLAAHGTVFERCWSMPVCSSTRATLLTGEYPFRHGIGASQLESVGLVATATTYLPALLPAACATALIGKWHVSARLPGEPAAPLTFGFDHHSGIMSNVRAVEGETYEAWPKVEDGVELGLQTTYVTTDQVDEAIDWIGAQPDPWCCVLSLTAAHEPFEAPPAALAPVGTAPTQRELFRAMVEAADLELGRLLAAIDQDVLAATVVIVVGDNGSFEPVKPPELAGKRAKSSVYEGGVRVPLVFCGRGVPVGRRIGDLVGLVDLWATTIELCEGSAPAAALGTDSVSMLPLLRGDGPGPTAVKGYQYTEYFLPVGATGTAPRTKWRRAVSDGRWKLIDNPTGLELFDLEADPLEDSNLFSSPALVPTRHRLAAVLLQLGGASNHPGGPGTTGGGGE